MKKPEEGYSDDPHVFLSLVREKETKSADLSHL
jgi:hypothetical protein